MRAGRSRWRKWAWSRWRKGRREDYPQPPRVGAGVVTASGSPSILFFFFQAEDGIRDLTVTGVQTCALPICGLTGRVAVATGAGEGAALVLDAVIEIARLARQVAKFPRARAARAAGGDAWECWQLDTTGWVDLPNSCFTYSDAGPALFETRSVATSMQPERYRPRPGQARAFDPPEGARP